MRKPVTRPRTLGLVQLQAVRGAAILIVEPELEAKADKRKQSLYFPE
jgi:hypothetical protein